MSESIRLATCSNCGCKVHIDLKDKSSYLFRDPPDATHHLQSKPSIICPTPECKAVIFFEK